jgi:hypothetical protein
MSGTILQLLETVVIIDCFKIKVSKLSILVWFVRRFYVELLRFEQVFKIGFSCVLKQH